MELQTLASTSLGDMWDVELSNEWKSWKSSEYQKKSTGEDLLLQYLRNLATVFSKVSLFAGLVC